MTIHAAQQIVSLTEQCISQDHTIRILTVDAKRLRAINEKLVELLDEAQYMLKHSRCIDDDATKCPACSLESRIEVALTKVRIG